MNKWLLLGWLVAPLSCIFAGTACAGVYSSLEIHSDSFDVLGDEITISHADGGKYWVVFQHAEGSVNAPQVASLKVDASTGHFTFRLTGEMAAWGGNFTA